MAVTGPAVSLGPVAPRPSGSVHGALLPLSTDSREGRGGGDVLALPALGLGEGPGPGAGARSPQQVLEGGPYQQPGHPAATDETELWAYGLGPLNLSARVWVPPVIGQCYAVGARREETRRNLGLLTPPVPAIPTRFWCLWR